MQMKDSLRMYNNLVESCFMHCVSSFRSQSLAGDEDECVKKCAEKYIKLTQARRPRVLFLGRPRGAAAAGNLDRPRGAPRPRARVVRGTRRRRVEWPHIDAPRSASASASPSTRRSSSRRRKINARN